MNRFLSQLREAKWPALLGYGVMALFMIAFGYPLFAYLGVLAGTLLGIAIMGVIG